MLSQRAKPAKRVRLREPTDDLLLKSLVPLVLLILASGPAGGWGDVPTWVDAFAWVVWIGLAAALVRTWRMGVYLGQSGIEIVGPRSRDAIPWGQIAEFVEGFPEARFWKWAPVAVLKDGTRLPMHAVQSPQPWTRPGNHFGSGAVEKLTELLELSRHGGDEIPIDALEFDRRLGY